MRDDLPDVIQRYWYTIDWDVETLWSLALPVVTLPLTDLLWQMDVPVWPDQDGRPYQVTPNQVLAAPDEHAREFARVQNADPGFPIEVFEWQGKLMILDGIHRLARVVSRGQDSIDARFIPASAVRHL